MMNDKNRTELLLVKKSRDYESTYGRRDKYRYFTFFDLVNKEIISASGHADTRVNMFDVCSLQFRDLEPQAWNGYDNLIIENMINVDLLPNKPLDMFNVKTDLPKKFKALRPKFITRNYRYKKKFQNLYRWCDIEFFDGYIRTPEDIVIKEGAFPEKPVFMAYFNNINKGLEPLKGGFGLEGELEVGLKKNGEGKWVVGYKISENVDLRLVKYELADLKRAKQIADHDFAYSELVAWAKAEISQEKGLNAKAIMDKADALGVGGIDPDALIEEVCMKPEYKKSFYKFIKGLSGEQYATTEGFFFHLPNGNIVWEMPKYGASTYVFGDQDINLLMHRLKLTGRGEIIKNEVIKSELCFIGRRKHPSLEENGEYEENWQNDVKKLAGIEI